MNVTRYNTSNPVLKVMVIMVGIRVLYNSLEYYNNVLGTNNLFLSLGAPYFRILLVLSANITDATVHSKTEP